MSPQGEAAAAWPDSLWRSTAPDQTQHPPLNGHIDSDVLVIGAGGILVELYQDTTCLLLPVHEDDVRAAIPGLKIAKLLDGFRGGPKGDIDALVEAIMAVARYAQENRDTLTELDINPLFVLPEGQGVVAVDALIRKA